MEMRKEWTARWSGGMKEAAVLIRDGEAFPQSHFARHVRHVPGGSELYRADTDDIVLLLYQSGSGKTQTAREIGGPRFWDNWDVAEGELGLEEGALKRAFWGGLE